LDVIQVLVAQLDRAIAS